MSYNRQYRQKTAPRLLPFVVEFVKFSTAFAVIITAALLTLHIASSAMG
jgi:hypothetical protein